MFELYSEEEIKEIKNRLSKMTNEERKQRRIRLESIENGAEPITEEEKDYLIRYNRVKKEQEEKNKDYNNRMSLAKEEATKLMDTYFPKEYRIDGYFNSNEFKEILKKVKMEIVDNFDDNIIINGKKIKDYNENTINEAIEIYEEQESIRILKEKYNIEWQPPYHFLDNNYIEKINEIQNKYKVILPLDYVKYKQIFC